MPLISIHIKNLKVARESACWRKPHETLLNARLCSAFCAAKWRHGTRRYLILRDLMSLPETENKSRRLGGGGGSLKRTRLQPKFPANREKCREFRAFLRFASRATEPKPVSRATLRPSNPSPRTNRNRELIRAYQGNYREEQGIFSPLRLVRTRACSDRVCSPCRYPRVNNSRIEGAKLIEPFPTAGIGAQA